MTAVLLRLRAEARTRWLAWVAFAALAGVVGGATIAALAGARRTETAYPRFLDATAAFDALVSNGTTEDNFNRQLDVDDVARLPQVAELALVNNYYIRGGTAPSGRAVGVTDIVALASPDGRFGTELNQVRLLEGRLPRGQGEVAVTFLARDNLGLDIGTTLSLRLTGPDASDGPTTDFRVVGTVAMQAGFPPLTGGLPPPVLLSSAFGQAHPDAIEIFAVRLKRGAADLAAFERGLNRLAGGEQVLTANQTDFTSAVQRSLDVEATALRLLSALMAVVALLLLAQALARQAVLDSDDHGVLRALGATQSELRAFGLVRSMLLGSVAAGMAVVAAVALSTLTPVGVARQAEINPGLEVNAAYVGGGAVAVFFALFALGAVPAWWTTRLTGRPRVDRGRESPGRAVTVVARAGFSAPAVSGLRMAFETGHGRSAVPARSTIASVALGVATIAGVVSFSTSLGNLFDDPELYGWNWDVQIGDAFSPSLGGEAERLARHPGVIAVAVGSTTRIQIGQLLVDTLASEPRRGVIEPTVIEGRPPRGPREILLGTRTLGELGLSVGDTVTVRLGDRESPMEVVGRGVLTEFGGGARLGEGMAMTLEGLRRIHPDVPDNVVLVRLRPGAGGDRLLRELVTDPPGNLYLPTKPSDLADLERIGGLPSLVAGLMSVMAVATLVHTLMTSVRRHRRDLAVLKVLGFVRRQVLATVAWQSSALAVAGLVVGVPLGVAAGRWTWSLFAGRLGVPAEPATPVLAVLLLCLVTVLVTDVIAALPGRLAARTAPAAVLRTE